MEKRILLFLGIGLILRLVAWWLLPSVLMDDAYFYNEIALNLLKEKRFLGSEGLAYRPPLQSFFIFLCYWLFGAKTFLASLIQILFSLLAGILVWQIVLTISGKKAAFIAFVLWMISFDLALFTPLLMSETIFIFLLSLGFWLLIKLKSDPGKKIFWLGLGLSWGLSSLAKPILLPIFVVILIFLKKEKIVKKYQQILFLGMILVLPALLWSFRNTMIFKKPVFVSTNSGLNFYIGNNPYSLGTYDKNTEKILDIFVDKSEIEKNNLYFQRGVEFILANPGRAFLNLVRKPFFLFATFGGSAEGLIARVIDFHGINLKNISRLLFATGQLISYWLILFGAIYYLIAEREKILSNIWLKLLLVFTFGYIFSLLPFFTFPRFRIPLLFPLIVFASLGIHNLFKDKKINSKSLFFSILIFCLLTIRDWFKIFRLFL